MVCAKDENFDLGQISLELGQWLSPVTHQHRPLLGMGDRYKDFIHCGAQKEVLPIPNLDRRPLASPNVRWRS
jgi:hypothetical protein